MIVPDANILLYSANRDAVHHSAARDWWEDVMSGSEPIGLTWLVLLAFVRVSTHRQILPKPLTTPEAIGLIDEWLARPPVRLIEPTDRHWDILKSLLRPSGTAGNLTSDAHLAAIAMSHGARICSTDSDFSRFSGLSWSNPIAGPRGAKPPRAAESDQGSNL